MSTTNLPVSDGWNGIAGIRSYPTLSHTLSGRLEGEGEDQPASAPSTIQEERRRSWSKSRFPPRITQQCPHPSPGKPATNRYAFCWRICLDVSLRSRERKGQTPSSPRVHRFHLGPVLKLSGPLGLGSIRAREKDLRRHLPITKDEDGSTYPASLDPVCPGGMNNNRLLPS